MVILVPILNRQRTYSGLWHGLLSNYNYMLHQNVIGTVVRKLSTAGYSTEEKNLYCPPVVGGGVEWCRRQCKRWHRALCKAYICDSLPSLIWNHLNDCQKRGLQRWETTVLQSNMWYVFDGGLFHADWKEQHITDVSTLFSWCLRRY